MVMTRQGNWGRNLFLFLAMVDAILPMNSYRKGLILQINAFLNLQEHDFILIPIFQTWPYDVEVLSR